MNMKQHKANSKSEKRSKSPNAGAFVVRSAEGHGLTSSAKASAKSRAETNLRLIGSGRIQTVK